MLKKTLKSILSATQLSPPTGSQDLHDIKYNYSLEVAIVAFKSLFTQVRTLKWQFTPIVTPMDVLKTVHALTVHLS